MAGPTTTIITSVVTMTMSKLANALRARSNGAVRDPRHAARERVAADPPTLVAPDEEVGTSVPVSERGIEL